MKNDKFTPPMAALSDDLLLRLEYHTAENLKEIRAEIKKRGLK